MNRFGSDRNVDIAAGITTLVTLVAFIAAWVTHVLVSIKTGAWILLIVGIFVPPIGWVHGIGVWFGLA